MKTDWLLIDGYSLMHCDPEFASLVMHRFDAARDRLIRKLEKIPALDASRTTIVFDGKSGDVAYDQMSSSVEVVYTPARYTADGLIERWVQEVGMQMSILVVTADRLERDTVSAAGARCMSCVQFLDLFVNRSVEVKMNLSAARTPSFRLGDQFPEGWL